MFYLDLDEIETLNSKLRLVRRNTFAPYAFYDRDHYTDNGLSAREGIEAFARSKGISDPIGKVYLLTHLRTWGHVFNPVSFYFVCGRDKQALCAIAEVGNTFNERKMFLISADSSGNSNAIQTKEFYVSPYSDLDTRFHFRLKEPSSCLRLAIDQSDTNGIYFRSALSGKREDISDWRLFLYALRFPLITVSIVAAIHWQALLLYLKGIRARPKKENSGLQTETTPYLVAEKHSIH